MPATVINSYSAELAQVQPPGYAPLKPNQYEGRVRIAVFTKQFATEAAGEDVALCELPKGARIIDGVIQANATTGAALISVGLMGKDRSGFIDASLAVSDDVAALRAAAAVTTAQSPLAATQALKSLYETEKALYVTATTSAAAMANQLISGFVRYTVD